jgi:hypothetical protein
LKISVTRIASRLTLAVLLSFAWSILPARLVSAQESGVIDEAVFWERLQRTDQFLTLALGQSGAARAATLAEINALWENVARVRLWDETVIAVDVDWLRVSDSSTPADLRERQNWIRAALAFLARRAPLRDAAGLLSALERLRGDGRFNYPEERDSAPAPREEPTPTLRASPGALSLGVGLSQLLLIALGVLIVIAVLIYFARHLLIQPAEIDLSSDDDAVPPTAEAADSLADQSSAIQDYRAAVRYLYLSSLLLLDERGVILFDPALTNREHLRQVIDRPEIGDLLRTIVNVFDRVWYGFAPVDEALYRQFRQRIEQLKRITA